METTSVPQAVEAVRRLEEQLTSQLGKNNFYSSYDNETLDQIRSLCTSALLSDFAAAAEQHVEDRLWNAHHKVNTQFRSTLARLKQDAEWRVVERRKAGAEYLRFIKQSQKFYRGLIRDLAETYGGVPELEQVAGRVNRNYAPVQTASTRATSPELGTQILLSCHRTLIQLGDLSRYRETELGARERNWAPAVGFYDLARALYPASGTPHNQLAIIALADDNLFRATYHLYLALTVKEPHISAGGNLRKAFFKIATAWEKDELIRRGPGATSSSQLTAWYLRLVSIYYHGKTFPEHEELENEVLSRFTADLKACPGDSPHYKIVLTSISAGHAAEERFKADGDNQHYMQSYLFFFRFNLGAFLAMLEVYDEALQKRIEDQKARTETGPADCSEDMSPVLERLLPTMRFYVSWLMKNVRVLEHPIDSKPQLTGKFWRTFAKVLTDIAGTFRSVSTAETTYMLDEDVETVAYQPLQCPDNTENWYEGDDLKKKYQDFPQGSRDLPAENLARLKLILVAALKLAKYEHCPLKFDLGGFRWYYEADGLPSDTATDMPPTRGVVIPVAPPNLETKAESPTESVEPAAVDPVRDNEHGALAQDLEAERMVADLVGVTQLDQSASLDSLPEQDDPKTPPQHSPNIGNYASTASAYPSGTFTADALVDAVRGYAVHPTKSLSPQSHSPGALYSAPRSRNQSQVQSPAMIPQPLGPSTYTSAFSTRNATAYGPSQPRPLEHSVSHLNGFQQSLTSMSSVNFVPSSVPQHGQADGVGHHARVPSAGSNNSMWASDLPNPNGHWSATGRRSSQTRLGNGTFGAFNGSPRLDGGGGSLLWGDANSPWNPTNGTGPTSMTPINPWNPVNREQRAPSYVNSPTDPHVKDETAVWRPNPRPVA